MGIAIKHVVGPDERFCDICKFYFSNSTGGPWHTTDMGDFHIECEQKQEIAQLREKVGEQEKEMIVFGKYNCDLLGKIATLEAALKQISYREHYPLCDAGFAKQGICKCVIGAAKKALAGASTKSHD